MKKLLGILVVLLIVGCGENPAGPGTQGPSPEDKVRVQWGGTSGSHYFYAKELIPRGDGNFDSIEKKHPLHNAYDFESNLPIRHVDAQFNPKIDYSQYTPEVQISIKNGTIRVIGNKGKYFQIIYYYYK